MELESFILSAIILLTVASILGMLFKHLGLGSIAGLLVTGLIVGPHTPGPYITTHVEGVRSFTELGVVLLLFVIGLELRPARLWALRREIFGLGSLQIILCASAIAGYMILNGLHWRPSMIVGLTMAVSSTAMVMQMLQDRGEIASPHGRTAFGILLMQDLAIVPMLAVIPILAVPGSFAVTMPEWKYFAIFLGASLAIWAIGKYIVPFILERLALQRNQEGFLMVALLAVLLAAWGMHKAGLSLALGAFLMGMFLSGSRYSIQIEAHIEPYKGILISLFFVAVGMSINPGMIMANPLVFAQHAVAILAIKIAVVFGLCLLFGMGRQIAVNVSFLIAQGGEFGFVLLASARTLMVIDDETFTTGIGIISIGMLATPVLARLGDHVSRRLSTAKDTMQETVEFPDEEGQSRGRVIIGGYGRVGHVIAVILTASRVPFIAFDNNPDNVAKGKKDGFPVYFGDISSPALLAKAHTEESALVALTVDNEKTVIQTISHVKNHYAGVPVIARARDLEASGRMIQAGAAAALPEAIESSLRLATDILRMVGVPTDNVDMLLSSVRSKNYSLIDTKE